MKKIKVLLLPTHPGGVAYYRQLLPHLALQDSQVVEVMTSPNGAGDTWFNDLVGADEWLLSQEPDIIHFGWTNRLEQLEMVVALRGKSGAHLVIDYDDDVLAVESKNVNYAHYHEGTFSRRVARLGMRVADAVTVSTAPLAKALQHECRAIHHLPNFTHPPHWEGLPINPRRHLDKSVRVMFAGGPSHLGDLNHVREAVEWMMGHYDGKEGRPHVKLIFFGCMADWAGKWLESRSEPQANRAFYIQQTGEDVGGWHRAIKWVAPDVLMAPLTHNRFNESKSLIKAYDAAMVEGCAFACEEWPAYEEVPDLACARVGGLSGAYPNWMDTLGTLIEDAKHRQDLSTNLRSWVLANRAILAHTSRWEDAYRAVLSKPLVREMGDLVRPRIYSPNGGLARDQD